MITTLLAALILACPSPQDADLPRMSDQVDVWTSGEGGYHTYRIPAVVQSPNGALLAFCEGRKGGRGDSGDIDLLMKRSDDGGATWGEQRVLWDDGDNVCGNPCPVLDRDTGVIFL